MAKKATETTVTTQSTSTVKRKETKVSLKQRLEAFKTALRSRLDNIKKRLGLKSKKVRKLTKNDRKLARQQKARGIIGIGLLFVVVSIAYSTYMTVLFVDGTAMVVALTPQVIFAAITLLIAFYKIYK